VRAAMQVLHGTRWGLGGGGEVVRSLAKSYVAAITASLASSQGGA